MPVRRWSVVAYLSLTVGTAAATARAEAPVSAQARAYFRNGVELLEQTPPNYADAYYQFKLAYADGKSWKVLGNLGLCAVKLERDGEALSFYADYLKRGGDQVSSEEREAIERDVLLIRGNASEIVLTVSQKSTDLTDLRAGSAVPAQSYSLENDSNTLVLRAGTHTLTATSPNGKKLVWEVVLTPGRSVTHKFDFDAPVVEDKPPPVLPASAALTPTQAPEVSAAGPAPLRLAGYVTVSVGLAAVGAGVITGLLAKSKESSALAGCDRASKVCDPASEPKFNSATSLAQATNVLLIGGGALSAVGLGLVLFGGRGSAASADHAGLEITPLFANSTSGLFASGKF